MPSVHVGSAYKAPKQLISPKSSDAINGTTKICSTHCPYCRPFCMVVAEPSLGFLGFPPSYFGSKILKGIAHI